MATAFPTPWLCRLGPAPHMGMWRGSLIVTPILWWHALTPLSCAACVIQKRTMEMLLWISYFSSTYTTAQNCLGSACGKGCYLRQHGTGVLQGGHMDFMQEEFLTIFKAQIKPISISCLLSRSFSELFSCHNTLYKDQRYQIGIWITAR